MIKSRKPAVSKLKRRPGQKNNIRLYQKLTKPSRTWHSQSLTETQRLAARLVKQPLPNVWLLRGELGSGKTTLVRAVLRALQYTKSVTSPTFVLRHDFPMQRGPWKHVVHVDAYRIRDQAEEAALDIISAAADASCLVLIEWPEKLHRPFTRRVLKIHLTHQPGGRKIVFSQPV